MSTANASLETWHQTLAQVGLWDSLDPTRQREVLFGLLRQVIAYRRRGTQDPVAVEIVWEEPRPG